MSDSDEYVHIEQRRRVRPWVAVGVPSLAVAAVCFLWMPNLPLYLVAVALVSFAALRIVFLLSYGGRAQGLGAAIVVLIVGAAVVVPWRLADAERTGSPRWTLETVGKAGNLYADGRRLLFSDDEGLHALDMSTGNVVWSFDDVSRVTRLAVAGDGHVLIRSDRTDGDDSAEFVWLSPDGEPLWRSRADDGERQLMGLNLRHPLASRHGVLVFPRCADEDGNRACTYVGVGPDGKKRWEADGYDGRRPELGQSEAGSQAEDPQRLPELAVIDARPDAGGRATVVRADDGGTIADIKVASSIVVAGNTVAYDSGPAPGERRCRMHGLSSDQEIDWSATTPCLYGRGALLGQRIYGVDADPHALTGGDERPIDNSFMIDIATGRWKMVGGLALFNLHSDASTGVPGADIVVHRDRQHLTATDPDTGGKRWDLRVGGDSIPGVATANGATVVLFRPGPGHNPFYTADEDSDAMSVWAIDTASGRVTGHRTLDHAIWHAIPAGPGQAVLVDDDELSLIGSASK